MKVFAAMGLGVALALYGVFAGVLGPLSRVKKERRETIQDLDSKLLKAHAIVDRAGSVRAANSNVLSELITTATLENRVLLDRLGNFLLGASEVIEAAAKETAVPTEPPTEVGISQIPQTSARKEAPVFRSYTVHVGLQCGTHDLIRLLSAIETNHPYLCVSSLAIAAQPDEPEKHAVALDIQWPIWGDPEMPARLEAQLSAIAQADAGPEKAAGAAEAKGSTHQ